MSHKVVKMRIVLFKVLLYSNLFMGLLNVLIVVEIIYQARTKPKCGKLQMYQSDNRTPRIVGGRKTDITEFPHIAALLAKNRKDLKYSLTCATVIISLYRTLTSCHCIDLMKNYTTKVRSGTSYWQRDGILHDITKVIRNEEYNEHHMDNDLAILCVWPSFQKKAIIKVAGEYLVFFSTLISLILLLLNVTAFPLCDTETKTLTLKHKKIYPYFSETNCPNLGSVSDTHTMMSFQSLRRFHAFVLMTAIDEKLNSHKYDVANGTNHLTASFEIWGYSCILLIQN